MTLSDLMSRTSAAEIALWKAYAMLEPIGDLRGDHQAALVAAAVVNMLKSKKSPPVQIRDLMYFLPKPPPDKKRQRQMSRSLREHLGGLNLKRMKGNGSGKRR